MLSLHSVLTLKRDTPASQSDAVKQHVSAHVSQLRLPRRLSASSLVPPSAAITPSAVTQRFHPTCMATPSPQMQLIHLLHRLAWPPDCPLPQHAHSGGRCHMNVDSNTQTQQRLTMLSHCLSLHPQAVLLVRHLTAPPNPPSKSPASSAAA